MNRIFHIIIEVIFWLAIFLSPVIFFSAIAAFTYFSDISNFEMAVSIFLVGIIGGIFWAERIRRKFGCSRYMSKILSTPDIWPDEVDEKNGVKRN